MDVQLQVYRNSTSSPNQAGNVLENLDYVVLILSKQPHLDVVAVKNNFRALLAQFSTNTDFIAKSGIDRVIRSSQLTNNVIIDSVAVTADGLVDADALVNGIRSVWENVLGKRHTRQ